MAKAEKANAAEKRLLSTATAGDPPNPGILVAKLNAAAMDEAADEIELEGWDKLVSPQDKAERLHAHYQEAWTATGLVLAQCGECSGEFDEALPACPFCGDSDQEAEDADDEPAKAAKPAKGAKKDEPAPSALAGAAPKAALAVVEGGKGRLAQLSERDLDEAIKLVNGHKSKAASDWWDMGNALKDIYDRQLWKLRSAPDKASGVAYRTFESFCNAELGMQPMTALSAMDVARSYSKDKAIAYGTKKLTLMLRADHSMREEVEKDIQAGKSKREIEAKVRESNKGKPVVERTGVVRKPPEKGTRPFDMVRPLPGDRITVAALLDKSVTVKLWKKPAGKLSQLADTRPLARAKRLGDEPAGRYELPNGVTLYIVVSAHEETGEVVAKLKFTREEVEAKGGEE